MELSVKGRSEFAAASADFDHGDDSVAVELSPDFRSVEISDTSPAGLEFALRLQLAIPLPLRMFDEGYSFDLDLRSFDSVESLSQAIEAAQLDERGRDVD